MIQDRNPQAELTVGCSNITQLQLSSGDSLAKVRQFKRHPYADLSKYDRSSVDDSQTEDYTINGRKFNSLTVQQDDVQHAKHSFNIFNSLNRSFLPGLGLGILVTSIAVLIWGAARLRQTANSSRSSTPTATTCYAASEQIARLADAENGARYLKLQATTSL